MQLSAQKRAKHFIQGYYLPKANEAKSKAFERARAETISNLKMALAEVEQLEETAFFNSKV